MASLLQILHYTTDFTGRKSKMAKTQSDFMDLTSDIESAPKAKSAPKTEIKTEVKPDPDAGFLSAPRAIGSAPLLRIKKEDDGEDGGYGKIDRGLPEAQEEDNMFEDVDEDEYVDLTYEGIAHVNGVRHFVCEGFKIRQIPEPFIVKRSLLHLFRMLPLKSYGLPVLIVQNVSKARQSF